MADGGLALLPGLSCSFPGKRLTLTCPLMSWLYVIKSFPDFITCGLTCVAAAFQAGCQMCLIKLLATAAPMLREQASARTLELGMVSPHGCPWKMGISVGPSFVRFPSLSPQKPKPEVSAFASTSP